LLSHLESPLLPQENNSPLWACQARSMLLRWWHIALTPSC
jgi:hypothetical protein